MDLSRRYSGLLAGAAAVGPSRGGGGLVWNSALYSEPPGFAFRTALGRPVKLLSPRRLRLARRHDHTIADPFLLARGGALYIFCEVQSVGEPGRIEAWRTPDLARFEHLGVVLRAQYHLSYPFVFEEGSEVYMLPESGEAREVALYRFGDFPHGVVKVRTLLAGDYVDSSLIRHDSLWYLFTTSPRGLEIFQAQDLENGDFTPHPASPVTADPRFSRGGGGVVRLDGSLYRIAQDCASDYGSNINIFQVDRLDPAEYRETLLRADFLSETADWNALGRHHLSVARFAGRDMVAVDGKQADLLANRVINRLFALFGR